jgi:hypothetical protein
VHFQIASISSESPVIAKVQFAALLLTSIRQRHFSSSGGKAARAEHRARGESYVTPAYEDCMEKTALTKFSKRTFRFEGCDLRPSIQGRAAEAVPEPC